MTRNTKRKTAKSKRGSEQSPTVAMLQAKVAELTAERDAAAAERDAATAVHAEMNIENTRLRHRIDYLARMLFGRRSEKLTAEELTQLALAFGADEESAQGADPALPAGESPMETSIDGDGNAKKKKRKHRGRTKLSPDLERIITDVPVPDEERACQQCDCEMTCIGHLEHEQVEYIPAQLIVHVERREKLVCKACRGDAVTAERKDTPDVSRRVGASFLAQLIESKCDDALPIYRQRDQMKRLGFDIPLNTLYSYWSYVTDLLQPVADTTLSVVLGDPDYVALDDTRLRVLDKSKDKGAYNGHLWCFTAGSVPLVAYSFTESWEAVEVAPWIMSIESHIQCDDYKGYSSLIDIPGGEPRILVPPERRLGCMMHVRRRFYEALKLGDPRAAEAVRLIKALYKIEAEAKERELTATERGELRRDKSLPLLDELERWVDAEKPKVVPTSPLGRALGYGAHQRPYVRRCFEDGRFEIDNGHTERQIREPAIGRKNYLFTGSVQAAKRLAGAYTLVQSCRALGFGAREYLIDVIKKLEAGWPVRLVRELVPDRWAEIHRPALAADDS